MSRVNAAAVLLSGCGWWVVRFSVSAGDWKNRRVDATKGELTVAATQTVRENRADVNDYLGELVSDAVEGFAYCTGTFFVWVRGVIPTAAAESLMGTEGI